MCLRRKGVKALRLQKVVTKLHVLNVAELFIQPLRGPVLDPGGKRQPLRSRSDRNGYGQKARGR